MSTFTPVSPPRSVRCLAFVLSASALVAGCSKDEPRHYTTPKTSVSLGVPLPPARPAPGEPAVDPSTMPPELSAAMANGGGPVAADAPAGGVGWKLPERWTQAPGNGMRFATIRTADAPPAEISVVTLGGSAGGELANVNRWRGQVGLGSVDEAALAKERVVVTSSAGPIGVFDLVGQGEGASRMIAGILTVPAANTWFFKMTGDAKALDAAKPGFLRFLESVHRE